MRNLLFHYCALDLSEEVVFGLGSGIDLLFLEDDNTTPSPMVFGRSITMESDVALALGLDYREVPEPDNVKAWASVRDEVKAGRPTMLCGDSFYLDYRDFKVHFPSHRYVLLGFDDDKEQAYVADRIEPEVQNCSYEALALSRNPPDFISTYNLWGRFHSTEAKNSLPEAFAIALDRTVGRMLGDDVTQLQVLQMLSPPGAQISVGLDGLRRYVEALPTWRERDDRSQLLDFVWQSHEKYGTGGGNFRGLFAGFLREAREHLPHRVPIEAVGQAERSADLWSKLACSLETVATDDRWTHCLGTLSLIYDVESRLFEMLVT